MIHLQGYPPPVAYPNKLGVDRFYPGILSHMAGSTTAARRQELGEFIRPHRERLTPEMVGFQGPGRRRTPGLRREEVAQLAGFSLTWYVWIEQGRDVSVSPSALSRL